ncbi:MAG: nitroreductase family protein [Chloroflexota bacterium]
MDVMDAIRSKKAVRLFADKPVSHEDILTILEAGRRSQSSKNTQPWQFIVVQNKETLTALSTTGDFAQHLARATFAIVLASNDTNSWTSFDLGQAAAYLQLEAWSLGIGSCIATIYRGEAAKQILGIPAEMSCMVAISFGYPSPDFVPAKLGGRKPIEAITHWDKWEA